ncbi:MAG: 23S rRNA (pseudouridine(1915)-N(3))-methyltransferase RlmH [Lachnospiraceae bacterium]|nr:23S rRNA (pseudouridine(1915)-N(3))-methyltransferase RlmH [Lachnospiraceae bacterium]
MTIEILCVGKLKEAYLREAVREYEKRLSRYAKILITEVPDERAPEKASEAEEEEIRKREAERILKALKTDSYVITLEIDGEAPDSEAFAAKIEQLGINGTSYLTFIIGGSLGLHKSVLSNAREHLSFSRLTFPHQLMRVILLEQIYRAFRIIRHEPYHK